MAWPVTDVQTYQLPLGENWFYQNEQPSEGMSGRIVMGWVQDPLYVRFRDQEIPVIPDLLHLDAGVTARHGVLALTADSSMRAAWEGPVGLANPRVGVAVTNSHWNLVTHWTIPVSTFEALLSAPSSALDISTSYGNEVVRATVGGIWRKELSADWKPSITGSVGIQPVAHLTFEAKVESLMDGYVRAEMGSQVRHRFGSVESGIGVFTGLTETVGTPRLRIVFSASWAKRPVPSPVEAPASSPVEAPAPSPVAEVTVVPAPVEAVEVITPPTSAEVITPAPAVKPKEKLDIAAATFNTHPGLHFVVRTNATKEQAEKVIFELQQRGVLRERVITIEIIPASGPLHYDFVVVE